MTGAWWYAHICEGLDTSSATLDAAFSCCTALLVSRNGSVKANFANSRRWSGQPSGSPGRLSLKFVRISESNSSKRFGNRARNGASPHSLPFFNLLYPFPSAFHSLQSAAQIRPGLFPAKYRHQGRHFAVSLFRRQSQTQNKEQEIGEQFCTVSCPLARLTTQSTSKSDHNLCTLGSDVYG